jgi:ATP-dependent Clp protease, protease subunit
MQDSENMENGFSVNLVDEARSKIVVIYVQEFSDEANVVFRQGFVQAERSGQTLIPIIVDSYGGEGTSLLYMLDLINSSKLPVATIGMGKIMSAGSFLLACGTKGYRYISPYASVMIHEGSTFANGKNSDLQSSAKEIERVNNLLMRILDNKCGKEPGYWMSVLKENKNADFYLTAEQALDCGLVDHIGTPRIDVKMSVETVLV